MTNAISTKDILPLDRFGEMFKAYRQRMKARKRVVGKLIKTINDVLEKKKEHLINNGSISIETEHAPLNVIAELIQIYREKDWHIKVHPYYSLSEEMNSDFEGKRLPEKYLLEFSDIDHMEVKDATDSKQQH